MKLDPILRRASQLARHGKYEAAMRILEPEVNRYHGSFRYYYLLGVSCLRTGDFGGALTWLRLARDVKIRDPLALLGIAALYMRRGETDKAVDLYLEVQELDEKNRTAKKALAVIRRHAGTDAFSAWLESGALPSLYPPIPFAGFSLRQILGAALALAAAAVLCLGILMWQKAVPGPFNRRESRMDISAFVLNQEERSRPVETGGVYRFIVTSQQAVDTYEKALALFTAYRDEEAKTYINRTLESNASEGLKNKSRLLLEYMTVPGFDSFRRSDSVSYTEVVNNPDGIVIYRDVHVIWRGMATNIEIIENTTTFDLLVGYDTRTTMEGRVPVVFDRAVSVNHEQPLEVLGRIVPLSSGIALAGLAIHQSARLENQ